MGSTAITAGVTLVVASGATALPIIAGAAAVGLGIGLCLNAAGATSPTDLTNPYYWVQAAPSIISSAILPAGEINQAAKALKLYTKISTPLSHRGTILVKSSVSTTGLKSYTETIYTYLKDKGVSVAVDCFCHDFKLKPNSDN